ncbi:Imm44 family immunity protein [Pseudomonas sp. KCJK8670]|uniref:Imm44 family immunity protein n=1 Tax=Pseudomonas sp. KCJK8670 TaxID=3344558 RepID=UPI003905F85C
MKVWMSSEKEALVGKAEHAARNKIEPVINRILDKVNLVGDLEKWSVIFIIMRDEWLESYPELKRYHKAKKDVELRVQLPFSEFRDADENQQVNLLLDALLRSVDMMGEMKNLKLKYEDCYLLKEVIERARLELNPT